MNPITSFLNTCKSLFLNGFLALLPIALTVLIFNATFKLLKSWLAPIHYLQPAILRHIPHAEILIVLAFIFLVGLALKFLLIKPIVKFFEEKLVLQIPLVKPVYSGIKQLVKALSAQDQIGLNKVVITEFPSPGIYCLGFITGEFPNQLAPNKTQTYYNVYIPTTPNPTTGYFVILNADKFRNTALTRQEAMTIVISGGVIMPERYTI